MATTISDFPSTSSATQISEFSPDAAQKAIALPAMSSEEFSQELDVRVKALEEMGLIDEESVAVLEESLSSNGISSGSNPMAFVILGMLDVALRTQTEATVFNIDMSNIKHDKAYEGADDLVKNAGLAFGITVGAGIGSLAIGYKGGQMLAKSGAKPSVSADPDSSSWAPILTNMTFQTLQSGVELVQAKGQADQSKNQSDIDRIDQIMSLFSQTVSDASGSVNRINQA